MEGRLMWRLVRGPNLINPLRESTLELLLLRLKDSGGTPPGGGTDPGLVVAQGREIGTQEGIGKL